MITMAALLAATSTADWLATELVHMQERIGHSSRNSSKTAVSSEIPGHR
jgi:Ca2+/Na+ antiporter